LKLPAALVDLARSVELVSFDVDGVLTDGRIIYTDDGREIKAFHVQDGAALKLLLASGIEVALLTGRTSPIVERRAAELGIRHLQQGLDDKRPVLEDLAGKLDIPLARVAHVGDDLPDLPLFDLVGFPISVPNGHPAVTARARYVTETPGGSGVARELTELLLRARDAWPY
jgi:3-deoxy-D-manno-octulosonate 8-phosphate phosphatase (KDO 8-P phosphatase)